MSACETEFDSLLFGVRRSIRYHNRRRLFFDRIHTISTVLSAIGGSATIIAVVKEAGNLWIVIFAAAVAVFSAVDLVVGTAQAARRHHDFAKRYFDIEKKMISSGSPADADVVGFKSQRLDIEAEESPPLKILDSLCHNELCRALGYDVSAYAQIKWYQRILCQLFDIHEHKLKMQGCK